MTARDVHRGPGRALFGNPGVDILWEPEEGRCPCCSGPRTTVRGFSSHGDPRPGRYVVMCFACWNRIQSGTIVSSSEWVEEEAIVFVQTGGRRGGRGGEAKAA